MFRAITLALAVLILAVNSAAADPGVPDGWVRSDYLAFLMITDIFNMMRQDSGDGHIFVACISNDVERDGTARHDPSARLMEALRADNERAKDKIELRLDSECGEKAGTVVELSTGRPAMTIHAGGKRGEEVLLDKDRPEFSCGAYAVFWHHAALWGGGYYFSVDETKTPMTVSRGGCEIMQ